MVACTRRPILWPSGNPIFRMKALQPDAIHYENTHRNTFIAFLLKHDGHQKSIKSRDFSDFRNVAQFERPFFVRTDKFNLHEINNLFIFYRLVKRQCPLFCKFRLVKVMCFTRDFHTQRCAPLHHRFFGVTAGNFHKFHRIFHNFSSKTGGISVSSCRMQQ